MTLPKKKKRERTKEVEQREWPKHRRWLRSHQCEGDTIKLAELDDVAATLLSQEHARAEHNSEGWNKALDVAAKYQARAEQLERLLSEADAVIAGLIGGRSDVSSAAILAAERHASRASPKPLARAQETQR